MAQAVVSTQEEAGQDCAVNDYSQFRPREYFREYYEALGPENIFLMEFYHSVYSKLKSCERVLEFGGGPTVYQLLIPSQAAQEIVFAEYLKVNREEVQLWLSGSAEALDWREYLDFAIRLQGGTPSPRERRVLQERVGKVTEIIECDAYLPHMMPRRVAGKFDVISSSFCLECISPRQNDFSDFIKKFLEFATPQGTVVLTMLKGAKSYRVGDKTFPAYPLNEARVREELGRHGCKDIKIQSFEAEVNRDYEGILAVTARVS